MSAANPPMLGELPSQSTFQVPQVTTQHIGDSTAAPSEATATHSNTSTASTAVADSLDSARSTVVSCQVRISVQLLSHSLKLTISLVVVQLA